MSPRYQTHKTTADARAVTLERKARRNLKYANTGSIAIVSTTSSRLGGVL